MLTIVCPCGAQWCRPSPDGPPPPGKGVRTAYRAPVPVDPRPAVTNEAPPKSKIRGVMSMRSLAAVGAASAKTGGEQQPDMRSSTLEYRSVPIHTLHEMHFSHVPAWSYASPTINKLREPALLFCVCLLKPLLTPFGGVHSEFKGRERMVDKKIPHAQVGTFVKNLVAELQQGLDSLGAAPTERNEKWPCRWIHMAGLNYAALEQLQELLHLSDEVVKGAKQQRSRPDVSWCPAPRLTDEEPDSPFDHLFVVSQYIQPESENDESTDASENVELRAELEKLSLKALRKRAIDEGQDADTVDAMEERQEVIEGIIQNAPRNPNVFKYRQVVFVCEFDLYHDAVPRSAWAAAAAAAVESDCSPLPIHLQICRI